MHEWHTEILACARILRNFLEAIHKMGRHLTDTAQNMLGWSLHCISVLIWLSVFVGSDLSYSSLYSVNLLGLSGIPLSLRTLWVCFSLVLSRLLGMFFWKPVWHPSLASLFFAGIIQALSLYIFPISTCYAVSCMSILFLTAYAVGLQALCIWAKWIQALANTQLYCMLRVPECFWSRVQTIK